jgi:hypothetical protein
MVLILKEYYYHSLTRGTYLCNLFFLFFHNTSLVGNQIFIFTKYETSLCLQDRCALSMK